MKTVFSLLLVIILANGCHTAVSKKQEATSPEGKVRVVFGLLASGQPYYQAYFDKTLVLDTSRLGLDLNKANDLIAGFEIIHTHTSSFDETWEQPWGEEQFIRNHYNELHITLQETQELKRMMSIVFRVYDDGFGFRYEFPEQENLRNFEVMEEMTEFHLTADHQSWSIPAFEPNRYEYLYRELPASAMGKVHTPVTFQTNENIYISIHEAALKDYSSMTLDARDGKNLHALLVPYSKTEQSKAFVSAPATTPWRTVQLAHTPGGLITSYLILNLNEPSQIKDISWFKPGKYIGIWWQMHIGDGTWESGKHHAATTQQTKKYIDWAAAHGFDGVLVEGWNTGWDGDWIHHGGGFDFTKSYPDYDFTEVNRYAREKGVYMIGHHETGGDTDNYERQMPEAFQLLETNGMKAVKTGYVEHGNILTNGKYHHGQAYIEHFRKVIQLAAQHHVAVVAHEPIKDTGERRTYPNMISREGARGQEFNAWSDDGGNPPNHETILPFTRCLAGPMDFTPGAFDITIPSKPNNQVNTTLAKQLALYVILYAPMQMACDLPEHYEKYMDAFAFIQEVGVDWETTKVLDAAIGKHITTARKERNTGNWFVGSITNEEERNIRIPLSFLDAGQTYTANIYRDGENAHYQKNPEKYIIETRTVTSTDTLDAWLAPGGGYALSLLRVKS